MKKRTDVVVGKIEIFCAIAFIFLGIVLYAKAGFAQTQENFGRYWAPPQKVCHVELPEEMVTKYGAEKAILVEITTMEDWRQMVAPLYVQIQTAQGVEYLYQGYIDQTNSYFSYCEPPPQFAADRTFDTNECFLIAQH